MEKTLETNSIIEAKVEKVKNGKPTIISFAGERFIKESPFKGAKVQNKKK